MQVAELNFHHQVNCLQTLPFTRLIMPSFDLQLNLGPATVPVMSQRQSLPYTFAYYDPYTNTIPEESSELELYRIQHQECDNVSQDSAICMDVSSNFSKTTSLCSTSSTAISSLQDEDSPDTDDLSFSRPILRKSRADYRPSFSMYETNIRPSNIKKVSTPRRYSRWRRSTSWTAPPLSHRYSNQNLNEMNFSKARRHLSRVLSKIGEFVFPSSFKQHMPVNTSNNSNIKDQPMPQKYTPLPSPLPATLKATGISEKRNGTNGGKMIKRQSLMERRISRALQDKSSSVE